jgi:hypothetical protein
MDMSAIRLENAHTITITCQHDTDYVEQRYNQWRHNSIHGSTETKHMSLGELGTHIQHYETYEVAKRKTTRIAHKQLANHAVRPTKHVEDKEHGKSTHQRYTGTEQEVFAKTEEENRVQGYSHDGYARSQTVNTVNEVDGISDIHHKEHRDKILHP